KQAWLPNLYMHLALCWVDLHFNTLLLINYRIRFMTAWNRVVQIYVFAHSYRENCISCKEIFCGISKLSKLLFRVLPQLLIFCIRMLVVATQSHRVQIAYRIVWNTIHDSLSVISNFISRFKW
ncbi:hypothetical protein AOA60_21410, partial [Pseudomonas sp. 2822-17]